MRTAATRIILSVLAVLIGSAAATTGPVLAPPAYADVEYTYSIRQDGDIAGDIDDFARKVKATLNDERGWGLGGKISFRRVKSGADMRLVLASPTAVAGASTGCSEEWSCRVGPRVLINDVRWRNASESWEKSLRAYQHYVVNHEVGHFLGMDHRHCPKDGAPAPVMQQQSIDQEGCRSNVWPRMRELRAVARMQDVPVPENSPTRVEAKPRGEETNIRDGAEPDADGPPATSPRTPRPHPIVESTAAASENITTGAGDASGGLAGQGQRLFATVLLGLLAVAALIGFLGVLIVPLSRRRRR